MLQRLKIQQLVLVEEAELLFESGLNIITGETGAGKTAILKALSLVAGGKADASAVREGQERARILAEFTLPEAAFLEALDKAGIEVEKEEPLTILREITTEGKSRAFINNQPVTLALLKELAPFFIRIIKQQTSHLLRDKEEMRALVDTAGGLQKEMEEFRLSFFALKALSEELDELEKKELLKEKEELALSEELKEIKALSLKEGELEALEEEMKRLSSSHEYCSASEKISSLLLEEVLPLLSQLKVPFDTLAKFSPSHEEERQLFNAARIELKEIASTVSKAKERFDVSQQEVDRMEGRISEIKRALRRFGKTVSEILLREGEIQAALKALSEGEERLVVLRAEKLKKETALKALATLLTEKRKKAAEKLKKSVELHLKELGMKSAQFSICFSKKPLTQSGEDELEFFLAANVGEKAASLLESVSGGELARVLLALEIFFAKGETGRTLLFDEIDANIGGVTATLVGEKLKELAKTEQLILITHFPQVAKCADHHLLIEKREEKGRTVTVVKKLTSSSRDEELKRMSGILIST